MTYNAEETTIDVYFPHDYEFEQDQLDLEQDTSEELILGSEEPKQIVTFFDDRGNLVEV